MIDPSGCECCDSTGGTFFITAYRKLSTFRNQMLDTHLLRRIAAYITCYLPESGDGRITNPPACQRVNEPNSPVTEKKI